VSSRCPAASKGDDVSGVSPCGSRVGVLAELTLHRLQLDRCDESRAELVDLRLQVARLLAHRGL